jgi:putative oxidoreductase
MMPHQLAFRSKESRPPKGTDMNTEKTSSEDRRPVDISLLLVRIIVGVIFAAHGSQKLFGAFGGPGLAEVARTMGPIGYPVTVGEFFGGLGLIFGFLCRFSAASLIVIMIGAIAQVHGQNGFFLKGGGFEYNLALIGLLVPILIAGPGRFSIGRFLPLPKAKATRRPMLVLE